MTEAASGAGSDRSCPQCHAPFQQGDRFCRQCGCNLDDNAQAIDAAVARILPKRLDEALASRLRDQKVVEIETSQMVAERAIGWLKIVAFFAGIPLLACGVALSLFGIKTMSDLQSAIDKATKLEAATSGAEKQVAGVQKRFQEFDETLKVSKDRFDKQLALVEQQQNALKKQVQTIERRLDFCSSKSLSTELENALEQQLTKYIAHLEKIGFQELGGKVSVCVFSKDDPVKGAGLSDFDTPNAFYVPAQSGIYIHKVMAVVPSVALREYSHHAMLSVFPKMLENQELSELEYGLVDYFPASFLESPLIGEGLGKLYGLKTSAIWDLSNNKRYPDTPDDPHNRGEVWAAALWRCRADLGRDAMDKAVLAAWSELGKATQQADHLKRFSGLLEKHERAARNGTQAGCLTQEISRRGLPR